MISRMRTFRAGGLVTAAALLLCGSPLMAAAPSPCPVAAMWNGVSDPCCIDTELKGYYRDAAKSVGGVAVQTQHESASG